MTRILFATYGLPHARSNGGEVCSMNFIEGLRACGAEVDVAGYTRAGDYEIDAPGTYSAGPWPIEVDQAGTGVGK